MSTWYVVTSQGRVVLAVYGSALAQKAKEQATKVEAQTGHKAWVETIMGDRPEVGSMLEG